MEIGIYESKILAIIKVTDGWEVANLANSSLVSDCLGSATKIDAFRDFGLDSDSCCNFKCKFEATDNKEIKKIVGGHVEIKKSAISDFYYNQQNLKQDDLLDYASLVPICRGCNGINDDEIMELKMNSVVIILKTKLDSYKSPVRFYKKMKDTLNVDLFQIVKVDSKTPKADSKTPKVDITSMNRRTSDMKSKLCISDNGLMGAYLQYKTLKDKLYNHMEVVAIRSTINGINDEIKQLEKNGLELSIAHLQSTKSEKISLDENWLEYNKLKVSEISIGLFKPFVLFIVTKTHLNKDGTMAKRANSKSAKNGENDEDDETVKKFEKMKLNK